jgi:hypothetical protein
MNTEYGGSVGSDDSKLDVWYSVLFDLERIRECYGELSFFFEEYYLLRLDAV